MKRGREEEKKSEGRKEESLPLNDDTGLTERQREKVVNERALRENKETRSLRDKER